ncbi:DUF2283 domain-containing protein [Spirulina sp. CCNP1310]|nr:DUF2283 domain-containing protein [Spirulina sp. CCNP1310]MEA5418715.1 DUF2283 domain-containing protein [Spirulina sp. CCNP1310]
MKIKYDPEVDVLRITLKDVDIEESDEETPGIILDLDAHQNIVGIEILQASQRIDNPQAIEYVITPPNNTEPRTPGLLTGQLSDPFFEPLPESELQQWE